MNIYLILFLVSLLLSAFFSGSETAYVAANRLKIRLLFRQAENEPALLTTDQRFLTTTLVGNNIVMVVCSSMAVAVFLPYMPESILPVFTTIFLLLFGEILPKSIASQIPNRISRVVPVLLKIFYYPFYPIVWTAEKLSQFFLSILFHQTKDVDEFFSRKDLPLLIREMSTVRESSQSPVFAKRLLRISNKRLEEIMIPRLEITAVSAQDSISEIWNVFLKEQFTRMPVYQENLDEIVGFYNILDLIHHPQQLPELRAVPVFAESMTAVNAMKELQHQNSQIAIVVNEHGGTEGLVTVEDLVEELVGDILDEFDFKAKKAKQSGKSMLIADGRLEIEKLFNTYGFDLPTGDYVTIAGLILDELGEIPAPGRKLEISGFKITVLEADKIRIRKVRIVNKEKL